MQEHDVQTTLLATNLREDIIKLNYQYIEASL